MQNMQNCKKNCKKICKLCNLCKPCHQYANFAQGNLLMPAVAAWAGSESKSLTLRQQQPQSDSALDCARTVPAALPVAPAALCAFAKFNWQVQCLSHVTVSTSPETPSLKPASC